MYVHLCVYVCVCHAMLNVCMTSTYMTRPHHNTHNTHIKYNTQGRAQRISPIVPISSSSGSSPPKDYILVGGLLFLPASQTKVMASQERCVCVHISIYVCICRYVMEQRTQNIPTKSPQFLYTYHSPNMHDIGVYTYHSPFTYISIYSSITQQHTTVTASTTPPWRRRCC